MIDNIKEIDDMLIKSMDRTLLDLGETNLKLVHSFEKIRARLKQSQKQTTIDIFKGIRSNSR